MSKKWLSHSRSVVSSSLDCRRARRGASSERASQEVNTKVETLTQSVEETQERTRKNEGAIKDTDQKAQAAQASADQARPGREYRRH